MSPFRAGGLRPRRTPLTRSLAGAPLVPTPFAQRTRARSRVEELCRAAPDRSPCHEAARQRSMIQSILELLTPGHISRGKSVQNRAHAGIQTPSRGDSRMSHAVLIFLLRAARWIRTDSPAILVGLALHGNENGSHLCHTDRNGRVQPTASIRVRRSRATSPERARPEDRAIRAGRSDAVRGAASTE
jgi:hypothetical protein